MITAPNVVSGAPGKSHLSSGSAQHFDVIVMADMAGAGDIGLRIASEIHALWAAGYRVGLLHLASRRSRVRIAPQVQRCVRAGEASVVDPSTTVSGALLVVYVQNGEFDFAADLRKLTIGKVILVADRVPDVDLGQIGQSFTSVLGPTSWAPSNRWVRAALELWRPELEIEAEDWGAIAGEPLRPGRSTAIDAPVTLGQISGSGATQWPATREQMEWVFPTDGSIRVLLLGRPPRHLLRDPLPATWTVFEHGEVAVEWLLRQLDALMYFPRTDASEIPDAVIATAMASGKPVVLPARLRPHVGAGAIYCEHRDVQETVARLLRDPIALAELLETARRSAAERFSADLHGARIARSIGTRRKAAQAATIPQTPPRALFLASNGIGLGHVARLLAIARRSNGRFAPVFATMAQAVEIIESFGYVAEYIPSQMYVDADPIAWDDWLGFELERLIDCYDAGLVVYDGNHLPAGLLRAVMARSDCRLAWVRQRISEKAPLPPIENTRLCDLIIEPGEIAGMPHLLDAGRMRRGMVPVSPMRLLDDDEPLTRQQAAVALGLDPNKPAILLHLGAGSNRDIAHIIDTAVRELRRVPEMQIAIAEWANAPASLSLWPEALTITGFPISRYFNAFDFSIAAAGYNSFHEALAMELPTIFVANTEPGMDDQLGRARFAQDAGAAFELPEDRLFELPAIVEVLLNKDARDVLRQNCRRLRQDNGAAEAAGLIGGLV